MADIPQEPLRTGRGLMHPPSHALRETSGRLELRASRNFLYLGILLACLYATGLLLLREVVWKKLSDLDPSFRLAAIVVVPVCLLLSCGTPIVVYLFLSGSDPRAVFDLREQKVALAENGIAFPLAELVAIQVCYERWLHGKRWNLNLVRRKADGSIKRYEILASMAPWPVRRMAQRLERALSVPWVDCATAQHVIAEDGRFEQAARNRLTQ
jgi:hypothetical protein